jgi:hypothetical protein
MSLMHGHSNKGEVKPELKLHPDVKIVLTTSRRTVQLRLEGQFKNLFYELFPKTGSSRAWAHLPSWPIPALHVSFLNAHCRLSRCQFYTAQQEFCLPQITGGIGATTPDQGSFRDLCLRLLQYFSRIHKDSSNFRMGGRGLDCADRPPAMNSFLCTALGRRAATNFSL